MGVVKIMFGWSLVGCVYLGWVWLVDSDISNRMILIDLVFLRRAKSSYYIQSKPVGMMMMVLLMVLLMSGFADFRDKYLKIER